MTVLFQKVSGPCKWVKLNRYCELTGDTSSAVHARRQKGLWLDDKHTKIAPDGKLWVNLEETEKWVEHGNKVSQ